MTPYTPTTEQALAARIVAAQREGFCRALNSFFIHPSLQSVRADQAGLAFPWPEYDVAGTPPTEWPVEGEKGYVVTFGLSGLLGVDQQDEALMAAPNTPARRRAAITLLQAQDAPPTRRVRVRWENGAAVAEEVAT